MYLTCLRQVPPGLGWRCSSLRALSPCPGVVTSVVPSSGRNPEPTHDLDDLHASSGLVSDQSVRFSLCGGPGAAPSPGRTPPRSASEGEPRFCCSSRLPARVLRSCRQTRFWVSARARARARWAAPASTQVTRPLPVPGSIPRHDSILSADANICWQQPRLRPFDPSGFQLLSRCLFIAEECSLIPALCFCSPHDVPCGTFHPQNIRNKDLLQKLRRDWSEPAESREDWPAGAAGIG